MAESKRVFISVAEHSADLHAAMLIRRAAEALPGWRFYGLTGPRMRAAGAETITDLSEHAAMLGGILSQVGRGQRALRLVARSWQTAPPDLVVLLDSWVLHKHLARLARRLGLPVLYYIAPQTWASRAGRNRLIAATVDQLACILPFEAEFFRRAGIRASYVGHPLFETLREQAPRAEVAERLWAQNRPVVALLPGSRRQVVAAVLPLQLEVIRALRRAGRPVTAAISGVWPERAAQIRAQLEAAGEQAEIIVGDNASLLTACDLALPASGTATLEVAFYRKPMIVMYETGPLLSRLHRLGGRLLIKTPHLSLVNILAGRRVVPEFAPHVPSSAAVARMAGRLLCDDGWRRLMIRQLDELVGPLAAAQASRNVCGLMAELLGGGGSVACPGAVR